MLKLFSKHTTAADLSVALTKARGEILAAQEAVAAADQKYEDSLLIVERAELRSLQEAKSDARIDLDHANAMAAKLEAELERAQAAEAEADRAAAYAKAEAMAAAARKKLATEYPRAAMALRSLLKEIAEAEKLIQEVNASLPANKPPLAGPESDRSTPALWKEYVGEEVELDLWAPIGQPSVPLRPDDQRRVSAYEERRSRRQDDSDTEPQSGVLRTDSGGALECTKRRYLRKQILPDQGGFTAASLSSSLALPALRAGDPDLWVPTSGRPADVLAALSKPLLPRPEQPERIPEYEFTLLRN